MEVSNNLLIPAVMSNVVFGLALLAAALRPMAARVFYVLTFAAAGLFNFWTVFHSPEAYLTYSDLTFLSSYRTFIDGPFSNFTEAFVSLIAIGQLLIGAGLIAGRGWMKSSCFGGIAFGLAIAPLGIGSAFPSTVVMAVSLFVLLRKGTHEVIWHWNQYKRSTLKISAYR